jgi:putative tricarboxylic transport membrane protein
MITGDGSLGVFFSTALAGTITTFAFVMLFWPIITALLQNLRGRRQAA